MQISRTFAKLCVMKKIVLLVFYLFCPLLFAQKYDLTGEWKGFAIQSDGVSWTFTANFSQSDDKITGGIYYIDENDPNVFVIYKMKGKIIQNKLQYIEYEILRDRQRPNSIWCYIETFLDIEVKGDSIFLTSPKAESWTKNSDGTKGIKCPDAKIKFSKKYEQNVPKTIKIEEDLKVGDKFTVYAIQFKPSEAYILPESYPALEDIVNYLKSHPSTKLEIIGHTDIGSEKVGDDYLINLSLKRAEAIKNYLVKRGISESRLTTKGMGSKMPIAENNTSEGRAKNRRTEFKVVEN